MHNANVEGKDKWGRSRKSPEEVSAARRKAALSRWRGKREPVRVQSGKADLADPAHRELRYEPLEEP